MTSIYQGAKPGMGIEEAYQIPSSQVPSSSLSERLLNWLRRNPNKGDMPSGEDFSAVRKSMPDFVAIEPPENTLLPWVLEYLRRNKTIERPPEPVQGPVVPPAGPGIPGSPKAPDEVRTMAGGNNMAWRYGGDQVGGRPQDYWALHPDEYMQYIIGQ